MQEELKLKSDECDSLSNRVVHLENQCSNFLKVEPKEASSVKIEGSKDKGQV